MARLVMCRFRARDLHYCLPAIQCRSVERLTRSGFSVLLVAIIPSFHQIVSHSSVSECLNRDMRQQHHLCFHLPPFHSISSGMLPDSHVLGGNSAGTGPNGFRAWRSVCSGTVLTPLRVWVQLLQAESTTFETALDLCRDVVSKSLHPRPGKGSGSPSGVPPNFPCTLA